MATKRKITQEDIDKAMAVTKVKPKVIKNSKWEEAQNPKAVRVDGEVELATIQESRIAGMMSGWWQNDYIPRSK